MGWAGTPTGAGLVDGGVDQGPWLQERVGRGDDMRSKSREGVREGLAWRSGGCKGFGCGGGSGRGTGPRNGANFAMCCF